VRREEIVDLVELRRCGLKGLHPQDLINSLSQTKHTLTAAQMPQDLALETIVQRLDHLATQLYRVLVQRVALLIVPLNHVECLNGLEDCTVILVHEGSIVDQCNDVIKLHCGERNLWVVLGVYRIRNELYFR
jgi:hypothetical protein